MDEIKIRPLSLADAREAAALIRAAFADQGMETDPPSSALTESEAIVEAKLAVGGGLGARDENGLIGVVLWTPHADALYLGRLGVASLWRGRGLASRLLHAVESEARRRGDARLRIHARIGLPLNRALFARLGYVETEFRAHPGYSAPTFVVMEKALD